MTYSTLLTLDLGQCMELEFLAEGAANIVYRIHALPSSPSTTSSPDPETTEGTTPPPTDLSPLRIVDDPRLSGKLLRLRKNLPSTVPVLDSQKHFDATVRPLLAAKHLVDHTLFHPTLTLLKSCNAALRRMEFDGRRAPKRHGVYLLETETHGTLVTDMTCAPAGSWVSLEFKPKWLVQSPSAPSGSVRCRTCALRAMKSSVRSQPSSPLSPSGGHHSILKLGFCPLSLVSEDTRTVAAAAGLLLELCRPDERGNESVRAALADFLLKSPLLRRLAKFQEKLDPTGVMRADLSRPEFLTAMTIRDCTLFLKIPRSSSPGRTIEARLGDLDLKTSAGLKADYWRELERRLIDEGWYTGTERGGDGRRSSCVLAKGTGG